MAVSAELIGMTLLVVLLFVVGAVLPASERFDVGRWEKPVLVLAVIWLVFRAGPVPGRLVRPALAVHPDHDGHWNQGRR